MQVSCGIVRKRSVVDTGYCPHPEQHGKAVGRLYSARGLVFEEQFMIAGNDNHTVTDLNPQPAWAKAWQLWTVFFPRRSITGALSTETSGAAMMGSIGSTRDVHRI